MLFFVKGFSLINKWKLTEKTKEIEYEAQIEEVKPKPRYY